MSYIMLILLTLFCHVVMSLAIPLLRLSVTVLGFTWTERSKRR